MPRFYFSVFDSYSDIDTEGTELRDWRAAQILAVCHAGEVLQSDANRIKFGEDWRMEVTDEMGLILFRLDFSMLASSALASATAPRGARMHGHLEGV